MIRGGRVREDMRAGREVWLGAGLWRWHWERGRTRRGGCLACSSADRDLLIWVDSRSRSPSTPEIATRSEPARSTKWHLFGRGGKGEAVSLRGGAVSTPEISMRSDPTRSTKWHLFEQIGKGDAISVSEPAKSTRWHLFEQSGKGGATSVSEPAKSTRWHLFWRRVMGGGYSVRAGRLRKRTNVSSTSTN
jgi:hypothetical protein